MLNIFNLQKNNHKGHISKNTFGLSAKDEKKMWKKIIHEASQDQIKILRKAKELGNKG